MTPRQYLEKHSITVKLRRLGVTDEQLEEIRFSGSNRDWPFEQWSVRSSDGTPLTATPLLKVYCTLKWLILDNPPYSRDKEDAWRLVNDAMAAEEIAKGLNLRGAQSKRAKRPRGKIPDDERTLDQIIQEIAVNPDLLEEDALKLWRHFYAELDELALNPKEVKHPTTLAKCAYEYGPEHHRKKITYGRFANVVSEFRNQKSR
jgi:hypothetical protein